MSKDNFGIENIQVAIEEMLIYHPSVKVIMNPIDKQNILYGINQVNGCEIVCRADISKGTFYVVRSEDYD